MCHTDEVSRVLGQAVLGVLQCVNGNLQTPLKSRSEVSAWDVPWWAESRYYGLMRHCVQGLSLRA